MVLKKTFRARFSKSFRNLWLEKMPAWTLESIVAFYVPCHFFWRLVPEPGKNKG